MPWRKKKPAFVEHSPSDVFALYMRMKDKRIGNIRQGFFRMPSEPSVTRALEVITKGLIPRYRGIFQRNVLDNKRPLLDYLPSTTAKHISFDEVFYVAFYVPLEDVPLYVSSAHKALQIVCEWRLALGH